MKKYKLPAIKIMIMIIIITLASFSGAILYGAYHVTDSWQAMWVLDISRTGWEDVEVTQDENNVPMVDYKNLYGLHIGKVYHPNLIRDPDWHMANYEDRGDYYLIPYDYTWYFRSVVSPPWYSCEGQGKALIASIEKYDQTRDRKYLEFSQKVLAGYNSAILNDNGWLRGVAVDSNNDAKINGRILNSQMYCMIDLHTYYEHTGDMLALELFNRGMPVLEKGASDLTEDCGTWYSTEKIEFKRHHEHPEYIDLLRDLYSMTGSAALKTTLDKWQHDYQTCGPGT